MSDFKSNFEFKNQKEIGVVQKNQTTRWVVQTVDMVDLRNDKATPCIQISVQYQDREGKWKFKKGESMFMKAEQADEMLDIMDKALGEIGL